MSCTRIFIYAGFFSTSEWVLRVLAIDWDFATAIDIFCPGDRGSGCIHGIFDPINICSIFLQTFTHFNPIDSCPLLSIGFSSPTVSLVCESNYQKRTLIFIVRYKGIFGIWNIVRGSIQRGPIICTKIDRRCWIVRPHNFACKLDFLWFPILLMRMEIAFSSIF